MIVRRLCVTPAVGSVMQWLLTRRKRTGGAYTRLTGANNGVRIKEGRMYQENRQTDVKTKTQQLLQGSLKHVRAAALAAALAPLAAVAASPAMDQQNGSGGTPVGVVPEPCDF